MASSMSTQGEARGDHNEPHRLHNTVSCLLALRPMTSSTSTPQGEGRVNPMNPTSSTAQWAAYRIDCLLASCLVVGVGEWRGDGFRGFSLFLA